MSELSQDEIEAKFELIDKIEVLCEKIDSIKSKKEDIDYFLETGNLPFQYYTITNDIANGNMKKNTFKKNKNLNSGKSVMEYFKSNVETSSESGEDDINENGNAEIKPKPKPKKNKVFHSRANIYDQYMSKTDNNFVLKNEGSNIDICKDCGVEKPFTFLTENLYVIRVVKKQQY